MINKHPAGFGRHCMPPPASNPDLWPFDLETDIESHLRWGTFLPNLGTLGLWVLELFAMYATDGQTDGRTKAMLILSLYWLHVTNVRARKHTKNKSNINTKKTQWKTNSEPEKLVKFIHSHCPLPHGRGHNNKRWKIYPGLKVGFLLEVRDVVYVVELFE